MTSPHARALALLTTLAALAGCGDDGSSDPADAGPPCVGDVSSCIEIGVPLCADQAGCSALSGCFAPATRTPCEERVPGSTDCLFAPGCRGGGTTLPDGGILEECTGTLIPCSSFSAETQCVDGTDSECSWGEFCGGEPTPCEDLTAEDCAAQAGCSLRR